MHDLAVLFVHHADDAATRNNLAAVRHFNPHLPVIPLSNWGVTLPGGYHVRDMLRGWRHSLPSFRHHGLSGAWKRLRLEFERRWIWRNSDLAAYFWALWAKRPVRAKRWVIFEWDMYANADLAAWYRGNWDEAVSATATQLPGRDDWSHFDGPELARIPESLRQYRMGVTPWAGTLFAEAALEAIAGRVRDLPYYNGFCELRVATVAKSLGLDPVALRNPLASRTLRAVPKFELGDVSCPSVWHRLKGHDTLKLLTEFPAAVPFNRPAAVAAGA